MQEIKYFWVAYQYCGSYCTYDGLLSEQVIEIHPFIFMNGMKLKDPYGHYTLANWKEISEEEYNLFKNKEK